MANLRIDFLCIHCGVPIVAKPVQPILQQRFCRICGSEHEPDALFCDQCGSKIIPVAPPVIKNDIQTQKKVPDVPVKTVDKTKGFIGLNEFIIDEKITGMVFENSYVIYDLEGKAVGAVQQGDFSADFKAARLVTGKNTKQLQSFRLTLLDINGNKLGSIYRDGGALKDNATGATICKFSALRITNDKLTDDSGNVIAVAYDLINGTK